MFFKKPPKLDPVLLEIFIVLALRVKLILRYDTYICLALPKIKRASASKEEKEIFQQVQKRLSTKLKEYYTENKEEREWGFWSQDHRFSRSA